MKKLSAIWIAILTVLLVGGLVGCNKVKQEEQKEEANAEGAAQEEPIMPSTVDAPVNGAPAKAKPAKLAKKDEHKGHDHKGHDHAVKQVKKDIKNGKLDPNALKIKGKEIPAPADVAEIPGDAQKTASGLASKVLKKGTGTAKPTKNDTVKVHYTGWTTDGKMFDSSVQRGEAAEFPLSGVIPGWTEGMQLMVVGEKRRFWIPKELAYNDRPGRPAGMLVFDVELLDIKTAPKPPANLTTIPADAVKTDSGLATKVLKAGKGGDKPAEGATVTINFTGWLADGTMFDTTTNKEKPLTVPVDRLFPGWKEGLMLMTPGESRRLWIPQELGLGNRPGVPEGMMVIDVELLEVKLPIPAPKEVAAPPADAEKTESGLASKVLTKGSGSVHPKATDKVSVHYSGWTTDGKMFDSSVMRGEPATFPLSGVIAGWTEGVQLMVEGEKRIFWIPEDLAYQGKPGRPAGMLVFEIELLKIN